MFFFKIIFSYELVPQKAFSSTNITTYITKPHPKHYGNFKGLKYLSLPKCIFKTTSYEMISVCFFTSLERDLSYDKS